MSIGSLIHLEECVPPTERRSLRPTFHTSLISFTFGSSLGQIIFPDAMYPKVMSFGRLMHLEENVRLRQKLGHYDQHFVSCFNESIYIWSKFRWKYFPRYYMSFSYVNWQLYVSREVCQPPAESRSSWPTVHASLISFTFGQNLGQSIFSDIIWPSVMSLGSFMHLRQKLGHHAQHLMLHRVHLYLVKV